MQLDDAIFSLCKFLAEYNQFSCNDLSGSTQTVTGTLATLFPGLATGADGIPHIFPARLYDLESLPTPCVGVGVEINPTPIGGSFSWNLYRHTARLFVIGTKEGIDPATGTVTREKEWDETVRQTMQLQNALTSVFRGQRESGEPMDLLIPWYRATYAASGTPTRVGDMKALFFNVTPIDENRFACGFQLEVME